MKCLAAAALVAGAVLTTSVSTAGAATLTGAELYSSSDVSFPTSSVQPVVSGSSIVFGRTNNISPFQTLMLVELAPTSNTFNISIDMTRLSSDWDPHFMIGDGTDFFGVEVSDAGAGYGARIERSGCCSNTRTEQELLFQNASFPTLNNQLTLSLIFTLEAASSSVTMSFGGSSGTYSRSVSFSSSNPLYFALIGDNDAGEQYQVDLLTAPFATPVPLPAGVWLLLSALGGLGLTGWRRKRVAT